MAVDGDIAHVISTDGRLLTVDRMNEGLPDLIERTALPIAAQRVAAVGGYAYVLGTEGGRQALLVVDVADPREPKRVGLLDVSPD